MARPSLLISVLGDLKLGGGVGARRRGGRRPLRDRPQPEYRASGLLLCHVRQRLWHIDADRVAGGVHSIIEADEARPGRPPDENGDPVIVWTRTLVPQAKTSEGYPAPNPQGPPSWSCTRVTRRRERT
jgi:hypothetical protein